MQTGGRGTQESWLLTSHLGQTLHLTGLVNGGQTLAATCFILRLACWNHVLMVQWGSLTTRLNARWEQVFADSFTKVTAWSGGSHL